MAYKKPARKTFKPRQGKVPKAVKSYVKKAVRVNTELKRYVAPVVIEQNELTVGLWNKDIISIPEGTGPNERVGNEIRLQGVQLKGVLTNTVAQPIYVRMIVGYPRDDEPLTNLSLIFKDIDGLGTSASALGTTPSSLNILMTPTLSREFTSLYDKVVKLAPNTSPDALNTKMYNIFIKLHNKKCTFPFTSGINGANPRLSAFFMYCEANQDYVSPLTVEHSFLYQTWYRDA